MTLDPTKNFGKVTVSTGYDEAATSIELTGGHGARLPQPSTDGAFNLVWWNFTDYPDPSDDPNKEIVRVTARSSDTLTITRAQESTSASTKNTTDKTYKMILAPTKKMIDDIQTELDAKLIAANNLSDIANATTARTNLGLGTIATQSAASVAITGGSITGITDLALADGGTGASTAAGARTNLGLVIGTDVQAYSANLDEYAAVNPTAAGLALLDDASAAAQLVTLGFTATITELNFVDGVTSAIQTQLNAKQPLDSDLTTIAGLTATTNNFIVSVSSAWASRTPAQVRATLDLEAGTDFYSISATDSAIDADIATHAALTVTHGATGAVVGTTNVQTLTNKTLTSPVLNTGVSGTAILDEDDMVSNSATQLATQQSIKAYVDAQVGGVSDGDKGDITVSGSGTTWTIDNDTIGLDELSATGTPSSSVFLRGDNTWATPAGSGDVVKVGTPANNQIAVWTGDGTLEGTADFTYDGTNLNLVTAKNLQIAGTTVLADAAGTTTLSNIDALDATTEATIEAAIDTLVNLTSIQGRTVTLTDAGADAILGWDDSASAYENLTAAEVFAVLGITATASELNALDGITATVTELNFVDGVTSAIQTQLDAKQPLDSQLTSIAALADAAGVLTNDGAGGLSWETAGSGDVVGPASATDNAVARFDSTTGKLIQNSALTVDDNGRFTTPNDTGGVTFLGGAGNATTLKTGTDGTFLFDTGAGQDVKFKGGDAAGANVLAYCDNNFTHMWEVNTLGQTKQKAAALPYTNDAAALGSATLMWSDLFLASGAVINFNNGDVTLTHQADALTLAGGTFVTATHLLTNGSVLGTATSVSDAFHLAAYDVDGAAYTNFITLTAGNTPTADIAAAVTVAAGGTVVGTSNTQTLTNKTIDGDDNTLQDLDDGVFKSTADVLLDSKGITIDGGGSAITTGIKGYLEIPYNCTITQVTMLADQSGSAVVDIWKDTYANYPPTDADTITASAVPTISAATKSQDATLTGWTTTLSKGDILAFNVDSASTITRLTVSLTLKRT